MEEAFRKMKEQVKRERCPPAPHEHPARLAAAAVFKETASGAKNDRVERKKVMALAQAPS